MLAIQLLSHPAKRAGSLKAVDVIELVPMVGPLGERYGDCNNYALEKRRELIALGWPRAALLLAAAVTETGEGHLVLVARTGEGDLVLDNRLASTVDWDRLPYRWASRQSEVSAALWVSITSQPAVSLEAAPVDMQAATSQFPAW